MPINKSTKHQPTLGFVEIIRRLHKASLENSAKINRSIETIDDIEPIQTRVNKLLAIAQSAHIKPTHMLYLLMYDIEDNKVRTQISKYLLKKGCQRIQKSVFLANTDRKIFESIKSDLQAVQECYDNHDSIIMIPISTDYIQSMKVIGKTIDIDLVLGIKNTLFF